MQLELRLKLTNECRYWKFVGIAPSKWLPSSESQVSDVIEPMDDGRFPQKLLWLKESTDMKGQLFSAHKLKTSPEKWNRILVMLSTYNTIQSHRTRKIVISEIQDLQSREKAQRWWNCTCKGYVSSISSFAADSSPSRPFEDISRYVSADISPIEESNGPARIMVTQRQHCIKQKPINTSQRILRQIEIE